MELAELVRQISSEEARSFLLGILEENEHYANVFRNTYGPFDMKAAQEALDQEIQQAVWRNSNRGFIDYRHASQFGRDWNWALADAVIPLIERRKLDAVVALTLQAWRSVWAVEMDDSDGITSDMNYTVLDYWDEVLKLADFEAEKDLITAVCGFLTNPPSRDVEREAFSYQAYEAKEFLLKRFGNDARLADQLAALRTKR